MQIESSYPPCPPARLLPRCLPAPLGRTTAVYRPGTIPYSDSGKKKKEKTHGSFRYAPTDHFTSVDVPLNTTVPSLWQAASLITPPLGQMFLTTTVWSFILCGLVEKLFKGTNMLIFFLVRCKFRSKHWPQLCSV